MQQRPRPRREDRPLYVPPCCRTRKQQKDIEIVGRYGRIGNYEFEYNRREDAAQVTLSLQRHGELPEGGLVQHVERLGDARRPADDDDPHPRRTMHADVVAAEARTGTTTHRRLVDSVDLLLAQREDQRWAPPRTTQRHPSTPCDDSAKNDGASPRPTKSLEISTRTFEVELEQRWPDSLSRRLLNAAWIRLFYSRIQTLQATAKKTPSARENLRHLLATAASYFDSLLAKYKQRSSSTAVGSTMEAQHFLCHLHVIRGDIARYQDMCTMRELQHGLRNKEDGYSEEDATERAATLFTTGEASYRQARACFPHEGHIYSQWSYIGMYTGDVLGRVLHILRSCVSPFRTRNEDTLTLLLAEEGGSATAPPDYVKPFLAVVQSLYSRIRLDQFARDVATFSATLKACITFHVTPATVDGLLKVVSILMLMLVETSGMITNQKAAGDTITSEISQIPLELKRGQGTAAILALTDPEAYGRSRQTVREAYRRITPTFAQLLTQDSDGIALSNERFRLSCLLIASMTCELLEAAQSPVSPLWGPITVLVTWMTATGMIAQEDEGTELKDMRAKLTTQLDQFIADIPTGSRTLALLTYALPEDDWLDGFVPTPLEFCVPMMRDDDGHATLDTAMFVCPNGTTLPGCCCHGDHAGVRQSPPGWTVPPRRSVSLGRFGMTEKEEEDDEHRTSSPIVHRRRRATSTDTSGAQNDDDARHHIVASEPCTPETPVSLVRLARLAVLSGSFPTTPEPEPLAPEDQLGGEEGQQHHAAESGVLVHSTLSAPSRGTRRTGGGLLQLKLLPTTAQFPAPTRRFQRQQRPRCVYEPVSESPTLRTSEPPSNQLILIDGRSVGRWHGPATSKKHFSIQGVEAVLNHYKAKGCRVSYYSCYDELLLFISSWSFR